MATKALRIPTPKENSVMNLSSQNNNNAVTKETNQAKDNSIIEDVCRDKVKGRSSNSQNLVQRNTNSEVFEFCNEYYNNIIIIGKVIVKLTKRFVVLFTPT